MSGQLPWLRISSAHALHGIYSMHTSIVVLTWHAETPCHCFVPRACRVLSSYIIYLGKILIVLLDSIHGISPYTAHIMVSYLSCQFVHLFLGSTSGTTEDALEMTPLRIRCDLKSICYEWGDQLRSCDAF